MRCTKQNRLLFQRFERTQTPDIARKTASCYRGMSANKLNT